MGSSHGACCSCSGAVPAPGSFLRTSAASVWSRNASSYDSKIAMDEIIMGVPILRWYMLWRYIPQGHNEVLEVCAGTNRNVAYYPSKRVKQLVVSDRSDAMIDVAKRKTEESRASFDVEYAVAQADDASALRRTGGPFDVLVDTFGLCSVPDPQVALRVWSQSVKQDTGLILLLEHGRSSWASWLNNQLDRDMDKHLRNWGCVWNRDIAEIVHASEDVEVVSVQTFHFGTTYLVVARPKAKAKGVAINV